MLITCWPRTRSQITNIDFSKINLINLLSFMPPQSLWRNLNLMLRNSFSMNPNQNLLYCNVAFLEFSAFKMFVYVSLINICFLTVCFYSMTLLPPRAPNKILCKLSNENLRVLAINFWLLSNLKACYTLQNQYICDNFYFLNTQELLVNLQRICLGGLQVGVFAL